VNDQPADGGTACAGRGDREQELAAAYTAVRPRLVGIAYAVLGTRAEAEDVVSDCWLRLVRADAREPVRDVEGWSVVAVARRALDVLRSARVQREQYVGPWLPEPLVAPDWTAVDPAERISLDDRVSFALLVVLETLSPAERTAWVLYELFGLPFPEIARVVGRSPAAVRQLAVRARAHVEAGAPRLDVDVSDHRRTVEAFLRATAGGDLRGLLAVLDPDVVATCDGGGVTSAARRPVRGAERVARFVVGLARKRAPEQRFVPVGVNGLAGFAVADDTGVVSVCSLTVRDGRVSRVDIIMAPAKLPPGQLRQSRP
jgi:RNA polymerase sigma-70 factor (ECF subfamily)